MTRGHHPARECRRRLVLRELVCFASLNLVPTSFD